jgi:integrase
MARALAAATKLRCGRASCVPRGCCDNLARAGSPRSRCSARVARVALHRCPEDAVPLGVIAVNLTDCTEPPVHRPQRRYRLTTEQARTLGAVCRAGALTACCCDRVVTGCGLRRGELLVLRCEDMDLAREVLSWRPLVGELWVRLSDRTEKRGLRRLCQRAGLPPLRPPWLQDTHASLTLGAGAPLADVSPTLATTTWPTRPAPIPMPLARPTASRAGAAVAGEALITAEVAAGTPGARGPAARFPCGASRLAAAAASRWPGPARPAPKA